MNASQRPADGDTRPCPQCRNTLVFSSRYPVLAVGMALERSGSEGAIAFGTNARGSAATEAVIIGNWWETRNA